MTAGIITDGYTLSGYVKEEPGLYPAVRFKYRPTTKMECVALFANWKDLSPDDQAKRTVKALAKHLVSWDVKDCNGKLANCKNSDVIGTLPWQLFDRIGDIVTQSAKSDPDPDEDKKEANAGGEAFAEGGSGN